MSIDAIIRDVLYLDDGTVKLELAPACERRAPAGQKCLIVENPVPHMDVLKGYCIWGNAQQIMMGEKKFAKRVGYDRIRL